jgi:hypothetical protein
LKTGSGDCRGGAGLTIGLPFQGDGARIARFPVLSENWGILAHYQARYRAEAGGSSPDAGVAPSGHRMQLWNGRLKVFLLARDSS